LRHYSYAIDPKTERFSERPLHDEHSDAASAFEYFGVASGYGSPRVEGIGAKFKAILERRREAKSDSLRDDGLWWMMR
jgi:hypothetical protein